MRLSQFDRNFLSLDFEKPVSRMRNIERTVNDLVVPIELQREEFGGVNLHACGIPSCEDVATRLQPNGRGLPSPHARHFFFTDKGVFGKATVAAALALGLIQRCKTVHLSSTDPAAHLAVTPDGEVPGLQVSRIDPKIETQRYIDKIILVTLPEVTHVSQVSALQQDLRRANVEPYALVLNKSVLADGTRNPLLAAPMTAERKHLARMSAGRDKRLFKLPWLTAPSIGFTELSKLVLDTTPADVAQGVAL
jgi:hypothetical protein